MKKIHMSFLVLLSALIVSCTSQSTKSTGVQNAEAEKQIREISMKWLELLKQRDAEGIKTLFAEDAVVYLRNMEPVTGPDAIFQSVKKNLEQNPKWAPNWWTDKVVIAASGDYAIEYGSYNEKGLGLEGDKEDQGKYVTVYRNINGTWLVYSDIGVSTKPAEPAK